jgi:5-methylcytosine-specific restriction endonuclease McrA
MRKKRILSEDHKRKIRESCKGINRGPRSEETKKKMSLSNLGKKHGPHSEETKEKIRQAHLGKKKKITKPNPSWFVKGIKNEAHAKWAKEFWETRRKPPKEKKVRVYSLSRRGAVNRKWVADIKERDGNKCQRCGTSEKLHAHHIIPWKEDESKRFDLDNGITYCSACHLREERKGKEAWNKGLKMNYKWVERCRNLGKGRIPWNKGKEGSRTSIETEFKKGLVPWNKGKFKEIPKEIVCKICNVLKDMEMFTPLNGGKHRSSKCKECRNMKLRENKK